jgi:hypothetical protein
MQRILYEEKAQVCAAISPVNIWLTVLLTSTE